MPAAPYPRGYWEASAIVAIVVVSLTTLRLGELLGPVRYLKPVFTATLIGIALHLARTAAPAWSRLLSSNAYRMVLLYCLTVVFSFPLSIWRGRTLSTIMVLPWAIALVTIIGLTRPTVADVDRLFKWTSWLTAIAAVILVVNGDAVAGRLTSTGSYDPNDLGALFCFGLPLAIGNVLRGRRIDRVISLGAAVILLVALMKTGSRGALIGLAGGVLALLLAFRMRHVIMIGFLLAVLVPTSWPLLPETMRERALTLLSLEDDYNATSNSGRIYLWKRGMLFAVQHPLVGIGAGTFEAQIGNDFQSQGSGGAWHTAHNTFVQVAAELGFIGLGALLVLLGIYWSAAGKFWSWKAPAHRPEYFASLFAYMLCIVFLSHGYSYILFAVFGFSVLLDSLQSSAVPPRGRARVSDAHQFKMASSPLKRQTVPLRGPILGD